MLSLMMLAAQSGNFFLSEIKLGKNATLYCWHIILVIVALLAIIAVVAVCAAKAKKKEKGESNPAAETKSKSDKKSKESAKDNAKNAEDNNKSAEKEKRESDDLTEDIIDANRNTDGSRYISVACPETKQVKIKSEEEEQEEEPAEEEEPVIVNEIESKMSDKDSEEKDVAATEEEQPEAEEQNKTEEQPATEEQNDEGSEEQGEEETEEESAENSEEVPSEEPETDSEEEPATEEKEEKAEEAEESAEESAEEKAEEPVEEEKAEEPVEEEKTEETPSDEKSEEVAADNAEEEKTEEAKPEEEKAEEPVKEEKIEKQQKPEEKQEKEDAKMKKEEAAATTAAVKENNKPAAKQEPKKNKPTDNKAKEGAKKPQQGAKPAAKETKQVAPQKPAEAPEAKVVGKFEICNSDLGGFIYILRANNGQLLYESKSYKSVETCREAIAKFVEAIEAGRFTIRADKFMNYKFILKSPTSNTLIYIGESYNTEASCKNNIESIKRFAKVSPVVDLTEEDYVSAFTNYEIPEDIQKLVEEGTGAVGKWEISKVDEKSKNSPFVYLLYANNGQLLYESRDYKTIASCRSGLETFVNTVKTGIFIVDPDKSGRYKFVLRSKATNSTMEYYGQNYDTKKACERSIESVYRFALLSPLPDLQTKKDA